MKSLIAMWEAAGKIAKAMPRPLFKVEWDAAITFEHEEDERRHAEQVDASTGAGC